MFEALPPPRDSGWEFDDLDRSGLSEHVELIAGTLGRVKRPQSAGHSQTVHRLRIALEAARGSDWFVAQDMTIRVDDQNGPEPDLLLVAPELDYGPNTKWFRPEDVSLVVEVESEETRAFDRELKPIVYAQAGIPHYLRVEECDGFTPMLLHYRLDNGEYELASEYRGRLVLDEPVRIDEEIRTDRRR
ncbi:Uma2 family endonuclease [Glycomyces artemisiae]|uniref:Uma2 family endonuclease n=1 Tax=Glycomyces artemisiae TaxID=1076443 RepID=A0A2T0UMP0_9ACTN|nr:Uma2 family endonuclease [Glycomyces artemisiae]PRY59195.1 Uma2 family endonuclease [Glycomyces artemisiae]